MTDKEFLLQLIKRLEVEYDENPVADMMERFIGIVSRMPEGGVSNPNNCESCDWKHTPTLGHCYMFKDAPDRVCLVHSSRIKDVGDLTSAYLAMTKGEHG